MELALSAMQITHPSRKREGKLHKTMQSTQKVLVSKCKEAHRQLSWNKLVLLFCLIVIACLLVGQPVFAHDNFRTLPATATSHAVDPNKGPSELNHHIAGWALMAVGLLAFVNLLLPRHRAHSYIWPALFVLAGLFLALWSDGEIWPRGNLSWTWLFQHDAEARQHKIYSVLLIAIGALEYVRYRGALPRFWKTWAFPVIAMIGAGMLLIHDHNSGSGVHSPEAQAYLVNPDLDVDGNPRVLNLGTSPATLAEDQHRLMHHSVGKAMDTSAIEPGTMPMNHSQMSMNVPQGATALASHRHLMTASMARVERQHMWIMIVGLAIGLFKFISDSELIPNRIVTAMWPSCMALLGLMLVFYRE